MKNIISIMLSIALLLGFIIPNHSLASQDTELERLILKSKQILEIGDEYSEFEYSISKYEDRTRYNFNWKNEDDSGFISAVIDSDGFIMSYDKYGNRNDYESKIPKVTEEEGRKIAETFLKKVSPEIKDNFRYKTSEMNRGTLVSSYYFNFTRVENDIPYINNTVNVDVDNMTGEVKSYYVNWDKDIKFPKDENIISKQEADKIYKEKVKFDLMYKYSFTGKESKPILVYSVQDKNKSINAKTGEVFDYSNENFYGEMKDVGNAVEESKKTLTKEELKAIKTSKDMINENQAESIAREFATIDKSYKLSYLNLFKQEDEYRWYLDFSKEQDNKNESESVQVSIDAMTKEIMHFNKYNEVDAKEERKYSKDQALDIAKEYLNKIQSEKSKQVEYIDASYLEYEVEEGKEPMSYSFNFTRKVNGILFEGDGFIIRVDTRSGEIVGYSSSWYKGELPELKDIVSKEEAYKVFKDRAKLELQYINKSNNKKDSKDTILAYVLSNKDRLDIDAKTGKAIDLYSYSRDREEDRPDYEDIEKSIAKEQIKILSNLGIYLPGTKFKPKEAITQRDYIYLLSKAMDNYVNYEDVEEMYKMMINQNIVKKDEKAPKSNVIREDGVKYIIRAMNYDQVADIKDIYTLQFKDKEDISLSLRGYIAIAKGLGIVNGTSDGRFRPTDTITREQAIIMIYNMLNLEKK